MMIAIHSLDKSGDGLLATFYKEEKGGALLCAGHVVAEFDSSVIVGGFGSGPVHF